MRNNSPILNPSSRKPVKKMVRKVTPTGNTQKISSSTGVVSKETPKKPAEQRSPQKDSKEMIIAQQTKIIDLRDKEIAMLKRQVVSQDRKIKEVKSVIVYIASFASKNATATSGVMSDWAKKMLAIINRK